MYCNLTREQATLYQAIVDDMIGKVENSEGIERKGMVLATMSKLKQVCNHPAQLLADASALTGRSGKLARLEELLEEALAAGGRALLFTQDQGRAAYSPARPTHRGTRRNHHGRPGGGASGRRRTRCPPPSGRQPAAGRLLDHFWSQGDLSTLWIRPRAAELPDALLRHLDPPFGRPLGPWPSW